MKNNKVIVWTLAILAIALAVVYAVMVTQPRQEESTTNNIPETQEVVADDQPAQNMDDTSARVVAQASAVCTAEGTIGMSEGYNPNSQTWWYTLTPNEPKEGCAPACVVYEATQETEVNWRCTGAVLPETPLYGDKGGDQ